MLLTIVSLWVSIYVINKAICHYTNLFKLDETATTLILGDSHSKFAFNDHIISGSFNYSDNADSYFYSYVKLKAIHKKNPQIDTLLLSFSEHNMESRIEELWTLNEGHLNKRMPLYGPLLGLEDALFLLEHAPESLFKNLFGQVLFPIYYLAKGQGLFGGFRELNQNTLAAEIEMERATPSKKQAVFEVAELECRYILKIEDYCVKNGIKLLLVNPPVYPLIHARQANVYGPYKKYFSHIPFLDFSQLPLSDADFADMVHLSPKGARHFSEMIENDGLMNFANSNNALISN